MAEAKLQIKKRRVKVPTVLQMEAVECGAASLAMVLASYGSYIPLEEIRLACGVSRDGSKASNIVKAARGYGLEAKGYRLGIKKVKDVRLPAIIHWNFNHFMVLEGYDQTGFYLCDPASGPRKVGYDEFSRSYTGITLVFNPSAVFVKRGQKPDLAGALLRRARGSEKALAFIGLTGLALVIPGLIIPTFSKIFIDQILVAGNKGWLTALLVAMAGTAIVQGVVTWLQNYCLLKLQTKLALTWSAKFFWHVLRLPAEFFTQRHPADISSRVTVNDTLASIVSGQFTQIFLSIILAVFYFILMLQYSVALTFLTLLSVLVNVVYLKLSSRFRNDANKKMIKEATKLGTVTMTGLQSIETLKATASEPDFFARWSGTQVGAVTTYQKVASISEWVSSIPQFASIFTNNIVLLVAGFMIMRGDLTAGSLVAFQSLAASFTTPVDTLMEFAGNIQTMEGDLNRVDDVLNYRQDSGISDGPYDGRIDKLEGFVELKDVSFGYSRLEPPLIENFNLKLSPGSRVALVGASGSGKSTVAKLVTGLYQPWTGEILFDGKRQEEVPGAIRHNSIAVVDQDINVFSGTVRDNLTMWDSSIPEYDIIQAAKDACIHDDITSRPGGYESAMNEDGSNFSGGQRQRLEIARSLVSNPSILIMDEAMSALDALTEKKIDDNIRKRGCTCLIVAHRLSTIRDCDEIIVMEKGKIVERGTHDELVSKNRHYARLIQAG